MKIIVEQVKELEPSALALSLSKATPEEFASLWFYFHEAVDDETLDAFADEMSQQCGSNRKKPLIRLYELMRYHEIHRTKADTPTAQQGANA